MTPALLAACDEGLEFPDVASAKLYEQATRNQWRIDADIDWRALELRQLSPSIRRAMATVYTQVRFGETFELAYAAKLLARTEEPWLRRMLATQVVDEARHVEFFSRTVTLLDADAEPSPHLVAFCAELDQATNEEECFLGSHIVLESYAHAIFQDAARLARQARARAIVLPGRESVLRFVDYMTRLIGRDESRHVALGVLHLRNLWGRLTPAQHSRLQDRVAHYSSLLDAVLDDTAPALRALGLNPSSLVAQAEQTRKRQLLAIARDAERSLALEA